MVLDINDGYFLRRHSLIHLCNDEVFSLRYGLDSQILIRKFSTSIIVMMVIKFPC